MKKGFNKHEKIIKELSAEVRKYQERNAVLRRENEKLIKEARKE
jgi:hypothetical protein